LDNKHSSDRIIDKSKVINRLNEIEESLTRIAKRRSNPIWIPVSGWLGYDCWVDYNDKSILPYPGGKLNQPKWFKEDNYGFDDLEAWCYLKYEQKILSEAIGLAKKEDIEIITNGRH